jgi:hypothetical protein
MLCFNVFEDVDHDATLMQCDLIIMQHTKLYLNEWASSPGIREQYVKSISSINMNLLPSWPDFNTRH